MAAYNMIDIGADDQSIHFEKPALVAITPGHLVQQHTGGVRLHAHAGMAAAALFAKHDRYQGKTIDDVYAVNDIVMIHAPRKGEEVWAWLKAGENVIEGDRLSSGGNGTLKKAVEGVADANHDVVIAVACEALNRSATTTARIVVRVV